MIAFLKDDLVVEVTTHPKKNKPQAANYNLYLKFTIRWRGFTLSETEFSLSRECPINIWVNPKSKLKGETAFVKATNDSLLEAEFKAKTLLEDAKDRLKTKDEIENHIQIAVRTAITGKPPRGQKRKQVETLNEMSIESVVARIKRDLRRNDKPLSPSRRNMYDSVYEILSAFFNGKIPLLPHITKKHLQKFRQWYFENYNHTPETRATYLGIITSIFNAAAEDYELIPYSPVPRGFTPMVKKREKKERIILEDSEIRSLYDIPEESLSTEELVAKYVMTLQLTTAMPYCDIITLDRSHIKKNKETGEWCIRKPRQKNGEIFRVMMTEKAHEAYSKLRELTRSAETLFCLPKLRTINKHYKRLADMVGADKFTSYDLRHTSAVHYMDTGAGVEDLAEILGHAKLETTRIYGKISEQRMNRTMRDFSQKSVIHQR